MPVVDPQTGEPVSDAPDLPPDVAGGKGVGDPGMEGASSTGGDTIGTPKPGPEEGSAPQLPGEKGGGGGGGSGQGA
ncbi:MAG TPA: hypothetical protein VL337_16245 [Acidimicrobiales bacterium]|nr:hypothetical protein [Acidimicrobiales bacterium]